MRAAGIKRAQTLIEAAQNSVGLEAGEAARLEIWLLVNDYILKAEQLKRLNEYLEEKVSLECIVVFHNIMCYIH